MLPVSEAMSLGAVVGFGFHIGIPWGDIIVLVICTVLAVWLAPKWLRQKIIWQKAALPYLSRLADIEPTMGKEAAKTLQALIDEGAPPPPKLARSSLVVRLDPDALSWRLVSGPNLRSKK
jgi:hypothetical protein